MTHICVAVYMSNNQAYIQALQWIIRQLQWEIHPIQDIIDQLSQEEDPNLIFVEAEPIFDNDKPFDSDYLLLCYNKKVNPIPKTLI